MYAVYAFNVKQGSYFTKLQNYMSNLNRYKLADELFWIVSTINHTPDLVLQREQRMYIRELGKVSLS
jgi:hypothetical protein